MLHTRTRTRATLAAASALTLALTASACTTDETTETAVGETTGTEEVVEFDDGWAGATDTEMSGVFGIIRNTGDSDLHLAGVSGDIDGAHELHEVVPGGGGMMMQEKKDGFVIPAGGELILEPGGDHIMLMELTEPITTGQEIALTLEFGDGAEQDVTISARDFEGGGENYSGDDHGDHAGHDDDNDDEHADEHGSAEHDG